jgi:hypothetical protein
LAGSIKYWLPECADWSACPTCYLVPYAEIPRNEGLLFTVLATTAGLAVHTFMSLVAGLEADMFRSKNFITFDMSKYHVERLAVLKRKQCQVCSNRTRNWQERS